MGLVIDSVPMKLHIETTEPHLDIQTNRARLELRNNFVKVDIHTEHPRVVIDQYECFATSGLKGALDITREAAQEAKAQALDYVGKVAQDGDTMAALENPVYPLPYIIERDMYEEHEFGLDYMPKARPNIEVIGGSVRFSVQTNANGYIDGVEGDYIPWSIKIKYTPAEVKIKIAQYASVKMKYVEPKISVLV